uniref:Uncharacterized protein n=1 Tax=Chromera velia CCMP2878 TaxID=1169474 RepID=A0A0G4GNJ6_9ALVE|eukprot:Cvel_22691.t1-p1 / transcript=Cvel_22691.t1 / gene=Cvel_22691 / organism=Chromera_velia_CCMP2878 / gene_product=hypothetical protein / transcript_product=hypothetical protein / location=Cvel_scaffold2259:1182-5451(+) / protein_length=167 / sequence_SO=supercontig / SO=protein_coding / is_pseudo=false
MYWCRTSDMRVDRQTKLMLERCNGDVPSTMRVEKKEKAGARVKKIDFAKRSSMCMRGTPQHRNLVCRSDDDSSTERKGGLEEWTGKTSEAETPGDGTKESALVQEGISGMIVLRRSYSHSGGCARSREDRDSIHRIFQQLHERDAQYSEITELPAGMTMHQTRTAVS